MNLFIGGICGTFMAGIAQLARANGHCVRGCDDGVYPPMSTLLHAHGIEIEQGYHAEHLARGDTDLVLIGNALSRGNPLVEHVLNNRLAFCSGAEYLHREILSARKVIAVAGTHGKTTTSSMLNWILHCAQQAPGYLIGGKPGNFTHSAELGSGEYFVIEADEYDTAFFDKRAKFVHYSPHIAVLNNLEFDHADIYADLGQIQQQFHHLLRIVPSNGYVVVNADDENLSQVMAMGCWSKVVSFSTAEQHKDNPHIAWRGLPLNDDASSFALQQHGQTVAQVDWQCIGWHNMQNALAAIATAEIVGVSATQASEYLRDFVPTERRLQKLLENDKVVLYDDFAHHPTAIRHTIDAVRARHPHSRIITVLELCSNTMRMSGSRGHGDAIAQALARADCAIIMNRQPTNHQQASTERIITLHCADEIISTITSRLSGNDIIITMSNGGFEQLPQRISATLSALSPNH